MLDSGEPLFLRSSNDVAIDDQTRSRIMIER